MNWKEPEFGFVAFVFAYVYALWCTEPGHILIRVTKNVSEYFDRQAGVLLAPSIAITLDAYVLMWQGRQTNVPCETDLASK